MSKITFLTLIVSDKIVGIFYHFILLTTFLCDHIFSKTQITLNFSFHFHLNFTNKLWEAFVIRHTKQDSINIFYTFWKTKLFFPMMIRAQCKCCGMTRHEDVCLHSYTWSAIHDVGYIVHSVLITDTMKAFLEIYYVKE